MIRSNQRQRLELIGLIIPDGLEYAQCSACHTKFQSEEIAEKHVAVCRKMKKQISHASVNDKRKCPNGHQMGLLYYRITPRHAPQALKRIMGYGYCPDENKLFKESYVEVKT